MRTFYVAAATLASAALLGSTTQSTPEAAPADMPRGHLVLGLHPPERVAVLDVATGAIKERRLPGGTLCHGPLMSGAGEVLFLGSDRARMALMSLDLSMDRRPRVIDRGAQQVLPATRRGSLWVIRFSYKGPVPRLSGVREVAADGSVLFGTRRRPPLGYPRGATADGIVFEHRGHGRIWNPRTGAVRRAPGSRLVAASADRTAWCGERCRRLRLEGPRPILSSQRLPRAWSFNPSGGALSPDGSLLAVAAARERRPFSTRIALVRTADGAVELLAAPAPASRGKLAWSRSGEWLYVAAENRRIAAYRPRDRRLVTLPVRLDDEVIELSAAD